MGPIVISVGSASIHTNGDYSITNLTSALQTVKGFKRQKVNHLLQVLI